MGMVEPGPRAAVAPLAPVLHPDHDGGQSLTLTGRLTLEEVAHLWSPAIAAAKQARGERLALDLGAVSFCDTSGAALILAIEAAHGGTVEIRGARESVAALLARVRAAPRQAPSPATGPTLRQILGHVARHITDAFAFTGEMLVALILLPVRRRMFRLSDLLRLTDEAGTRALPLATLLGFLLGLILAFQSAVQLRRFGAEIYVVNLVTIGLLRELGPLMAAVILSGRTGSAFAAELGTMRVNEELAALSVMGIDPATMLVLPRMAAVILAMPALTLALDVAGLAGMAVVMGTLGYPLVAVTHQVAQAARMDDLIGGLFKALCFGVTIAGIGCRSGMTAGHGPRAVGQAATAAVVGGIVSTIILDGVFAVLFNRLEL